MNPLNINQPTCHNYPEDEVVPHDVLLVPTQPSGHVEIPGQFHFKFSLTGVVVLFSAYSEVMMGQFSRSQWSKSTQWTTGSTWWIVTGIISLQLAFGYFSSEKSLRLYSVLTLSVCTLSSLRDNKTCDTTNTWKLSKKP